MLALAIFVLAVFVLLGWGIRRDEHSGAPIGVALIVFGLRFDALMTQGRYWLNFHAASQPHYTTNHVLLFGGETPDGPQWNPRPRADEVRRAEIPP